MSGKPKYAVVKWSDWEWISGCLDSIPRGNLGHVADEVVVPDAVVLRLQDVTVAPLLHTYASILQSFIETIPDLTVQQVESLRGTADYMHEKALEAEALPDRGLPT